MKAFISFIINFTSFIISGIIICVVSIYSVKYIDNYTAQKEAKADDMAFFCNLMTGDPTYGTECKETEAKLTPR